MIYGVGTDIVAVNRMVQALEKHGERFMARILAAEEMEQGAKAPHPGRFLAKRFAAKEAFSKAFGTGIRGVVGFHAIRVEHDQMGKPILRYSAELARLMEERGLVAHLSLSDEIDNVVAFVVIDQPFQKP